MSKLEEAIKQFKINPKAIVGESIPPIVQLESMREDYYEEVLAAAKAWHTLTSRLPTPEYVNFAKMSDHEFKICMAVNEALQQYNDTGEG